MESVVDLKKEYEETLGRVKELKEGSIIKGRIVHVDKEDVLVDIGYKSEGVIPLREFYRKGRKNAREIKPGEEIDVLVLNKEDEAGRMLLSYEKAVLIQGWKKVTQAFENKEVIEGKILGEKKTSGGNTVGFTVEIEGIKGFLPLSNVDIERVKNPREYIGKTVELKIIEIDQNTHNVVCSRKVLLEEQRKKLRESLFNSLEIGQVREGTVKTITSFGAFVDLGGVDGLVHLDDLSWGRKKPEDVLQVGQKIKVMVLDFNKESGKIALGIKQMKPDPWNKVDEKYRAGQKVKGRVVTVAPFGVFVELEEGIEGLARLEDLTWDRSVKSPSEILKEGEEAEFMILSLNKPERKLALGLKQTQPDPWFATAQKYPPGTKVKGKVVKLTNFGAFVRIEDGLDGLIRLKDISWTKKIKHPSEVFTKGKEIGAVVLKVDMENKKIALGMKQLEPSPWDKYKKGGYVRGKVIRIDDFGVFVELEEGIEGFVHVSELSKKYVEKPQDIVSVGQVLDLKILKVNSKDKKMELSLKGYIEDQEKAEVSSFISSQERDRTTLGDIIKESRKK